MKLKFTKAKILFSIVLTIVFFTGTAQLPGFKRLSATGFAGNQGLRQISTNKYITISNYGTAQSLSCWTNMFNLIWEKTFNVTQFAMMEAIQTKDKNIVLMGIASNNLTIVKFDTLGNILYTKRYTNVSGNITMSTIAPAVGNDTGFILGGGNCVGANFLIKCDANGNVLWSKQFNNFMFSASKNATSIVHSGTGYLVASDVMTSTVTAIATDAAVMRIDAAGNLQWYKQLSMPADREMPRQLIRRSNNAFSLLCSTGYNNGTELVYFFDSTLTNVSYKKYSSSLNINIFSGVADNSGGLIIDGAHAVNASINKGLLFRVDGSGNILWQKQSDPAPGTFNTGFGYMIKNNSNYIFTAVTAFTSTGFGIGVIDVNGNGLCQNSASSITSTSVNPFTITTPSVMVTNIPVIVTATSFTNPLAAFTPSVYCGITTGVSEMSLIESINIYPNPSSGLVNFNFKSDLNGSLLKISNAMGAIISEQKISAEDFALDFSNYASGIYNITILGTNGTYTKKIVIQK